MIELVSRADNVLSQCSGGPSDSEVGALLGGCNSKVKRGLGQLETHSNANVPQYCFVNPAHSKLWCNL